MRVRGGLGSHGLGVRVIVFTLLLALGAASAPGEEGEEAVAVWSSGTAGLQVVGLSSLRVHPKDAQVLFAHVHGLGVARSENGGQDWQALQQGIDAEHVPGIRDACEITIDPRNEKNLWLATKGFVYKSEDAGATWVNMSTNALASYSWDRRESRMMIRGVVVDPKKSLHVLAGTLTGGAMRGGLYESTDGGQTWEKIAGTDLPKSELSYDAWPIVLDPRTDKNVAVGGTMGFWLSDDRGRQFKRADPGEIGYHEVRAVTDMEGRSRDIFLADGRGVWWSRDGGKRWEKEPSLAGDAVTVVQDPRNRKRVYAVLRDQGLFVSEDARHEKWEPLGGGDLQIQEIAFPQREKDLMYFASPATGLHVSRDDGKTIEPVAAKIEPAIPPILACAMHPAATNAALAVTGLGCVFASEDRGVTWTRAGVLGMQPTLLRADPVAPGAWYAAGRRLLRSADQGATWEAVYAPEDPEERIVGFERLPDGAMVVLLERSARVLKSADGGATWEEPKRPKGLVGGWASSLAVDPSRPEHMLVASRTLTTLWTAKDREGGPMETWDGGATWTLLDEGIGSTKEPRRDWNRGRLALVDPDAGLLIYAADGLGVFARPAVDPKAKDAKALAKRARWVDVSPALPQAVVTAGATVAHADGRRIVLQVAGDNDTRLLVATTVARLKQRVDAILDETGEAEDAPPLWESLPDPGARLSSLVPDPHLEGRFLGGDAVGTAGVLAYGVPGAEPTAAGEAGPRPEGDAEEEALLPLPPRGLLAFSGGAGGALQVWDAHAGKALSRLEGHTGDVLACALSADGTVLATAGTDKQVILWRAEDGSRIASYDAGAAVNALAFHPSGTPLYCALEETWTVLAWNPEGNEARSLEAHTAGVLCLAVSDDGKRLASGSRDRTLRVWDLEKAEAALTVEFGTEVLTVALPPDGESVLAGGRGASVRAYALADGAPMGFAEVQRAYVSALALDADGGRLYAAGDRGVRVLDADTLVPLGSPPDGAYEGPTAAVFSLALTPDGLWLFGGDANGGLWAWARDHATASWSAVPAAAGPAHCLLLATPKAPAEPEEPAEEEAAAVPEAPAPEEAG